jgi:hypothetical protein
MLQTDVEFIEQNITHFGTIKLGYTRNLPREVLAKYELMYRTYLDPRFILTYWCGDCVFDMLKRLSRHYDNFRLTTTVEPTPDVQIQELKTLVCDQDFTPTEGLSECEFGKVEGVKKMNAKKKSKK